MASISYSLEKERKRKGIIPYACRYCGDLKYRKTSSEFCSDDCKFMAKVKKTDCCWIWKGHETEHKYGSIKLKINNKFKEIFVHRYAYEKFIGSIEKGMYILHSCDNRKCVNPAHLRQGTAADNSADASNRNRLIIGTKVKVSKLNEEKILEIRRLYEEGKYNQTELGKLYGVHQTMIGTIVHRKWWRHV